MRYEFDPFRRRQTATILRLAVVAIACLAGANSQATSENPCEEGSAFDQDVANCGLNTVATAHAKACLTRIQAVSYETVKDLQRAIDSGDVVEMDVALKKARYSIRLMQIDGARVLGYKEIMVAPPDVKAGNENWPCFSDEAHEIDGTLVVINAEVRRMVSAFENAAAALRRYRKFGLGSRGER